MGQFLSEIGSQEFWPLGPAIWLERYKLYLLYEYI